MPESILGNGMSEYKLDAEKLQKLSDYIDAITEKEGALIGILHHAQELFGYLPQKLQLYIARKLGIPTAKVYGVVTFYSFFTMRPRGRHVISACMGTACYVKGSEKVIEAFQSNLGIKQGEITSDGMFSIEIVRCIGACGLAPVVTIDGNVYGHVKPDDIPGIIESLREEDRRTYHGIDKVIGGA